MLVFPLLHLQAHKELRPVPMVSFRCKITMARTKAYVILAFWASAKHSPLLKRLLFKDVSVKLPMPLIHAINKNRMLPTYVRCYSLSIQLLKHFMNALWVHRTAFLPMDRQAHKSQESDPMSASKKSTSRLARGLKR